MSSMHPVASSVATDLGNTDANSDPEYDSFVTPMAEETEPLIHKAGISNPRDSNPPVGRRVNTSLSVSGAKRVLRKSSSDHTLHARTWRRGSTNDSVQMMFRVDGRRKDLPDDVYSTSPAESSLQPPRHLLRRSSSNPGPQLRSRYHDLNSATLQRQLIKQTGYKGQSAPRPWRVRRARTANGPFHWTNPTSPRPGFKWFPFRSKSDPESVPQIPTKARLKNKPLKSSLKPKSKSAAATPPSGSTTDASTHIECQQLRRVKTVDFDETIAKKLPPLPPLKPWSAEPGRDPARGEHIPSARADNGKAPKKLQAARPTLTCPVSAIKSKVADCAVTRTDVHVVAVAPSWASDVADEGGIDPATPTMQIVESNNGCYEVIWDDVPAEDDARLRRRSSSTSQALHSVSSTAARGLERVNSKLTEWTWGREGQQEPFRPQIVVFPDSTEHTAHGDHEAMIAAPPNSQTTSANASRLPSQTVSAHASRSGSQDEGKIGVAYEESDRSDEETVAEDSLAMLVVPDPERSTATFTVAGRRGRQPPAIRRLSNMEDSELKFRGHRDSVTLARSRIHHAGGISPELFQHRDSVSMAKKRMHARNHAISDAKEIARPKGTILETFSSFNDSDLLPAPEIVKEHASKALKSSSSASMLRPQQPETKRHIRIVE
ncbi:hypothetical protein K458DRAFT_485390 [Lentithecium fluviatile CBS 122367]|uniref:Uncharacterized protein n=1 Tax=Lentithecium fluviatile CBS 122367 TaxID=1168545 RepID=A0A6G1JA42_9PLEO|nr:hypothetical protein K458DRAFT_485390 [Lentithecium fluviatile CBS 122367]